MEKLDLRKQYRALYAPPREPVLVEVPPLNYLMVDGAGDPNTSQEYAAAIEALYGMAYTLKFMSKGSGGPDWVVPPLEGLWWVEDMASFSAGNKDTWLWTAMIMQPAAVTEQMVHAAAEQLRVKKNPPALSKLRFATLDEGLSAQVMHIGPYAEETPTIERLHAFIDQQGHALRGKHHEIYLSDPRRTAPEKLNTVIRQPVG